MSTLTKTPPIIVIAPYPTVGLLRRPDLCFWIAGIFIYGLTAANFTTGHFLDQTSRDLWQHIAALRALIADPFHPSNPFIPTGDGSRHFNPYWVIVALIARAFGLNEWQAIAGAAFFSAFVLLLGIHTFGRTFYRSAWGPMALLLAMVFSWSLPVSHTGYHSIGTFLEGFAYPAALLVGLSLLLWAFVLKALARPLSALVLVPLSAFMMATHQLGAVIGFLGAGCFIALWPRGRRSSRMVSAGSIAAGVLLAEAWPYHSPIGAILQTGNPSWTGGVNFYSPMMLIEAFVPSLIGIWGLRHRYYRRRGLPVVAAVLLFTGLFMFGLFGVLTATRFIMPAVLMLQIGVGALLLTLAKDWNALPERRKLALFTLACFCVSIQVAASFFYLNEERISNRISGSAYDAALALTRDVPDSEPIGAYDVAAWPIVSTGQRVVSVPWPEPEIPSLVERQAAVERLFDPALSRQQRLQLARHWGVKSLIMDKDGPLRRPMPKRILEVLGKQSVRRSEAGIFIRFDLE